MVTQEVIVIAASIIAAVCRIVFIGFISLWILGLFCRFRQVFYRLFSLLFWIRVWAWAGMLGSVLGVRLFALV